MQHPESFTPFDIDISNDKKVTAIWGEHSSEGVELQLLDAVKRGIFERYRGNPTKTDLEGDGLILFTGLLNGGVNSTFQFAMGRSERLDLRIGCNQTDLPWEILYDDTQFLSTSERFTLSRKIALPLDVGLRYSFMPPINFLIVASLPTDEAQLRNARDEIEIITNIFADWEGQGLMRIVVEDKPTRERMDFHANETYHMIHYIGHGEQGQILLLDDDGQRARGVSGESFVDLLYKKELVLVILNTCHGADRPANLISVGEAFAKKGTSAVVAMQSPVRDKAAQFFSRELYGHIQNMRPINVAVQEARRALKGRQGGAPKQFSAPVLYLRDNPQLFSEEFRNKHAGLVEAEKNKDVEAALPAISVNSNKFGEEEEFNRLRRGYLKEVFRQHEGVEHSSLSLSDASARPVPLPELFVFPEVIKDIPKYEQLAYEADNPVQGRGQVQWQNIADFHSMRTERALRRDKQVNWERLKLSEVLGEHTRLVLLGNIGSGKTTILRYLLLQLADERHELLPLLPQLAEQESLIPFYMPLKEYAEIWRPESPNADKKNLGKFLEHYLESSVLSEYTKFVQGAIENGHVIFLFDGLDEVPITVPITDEANSIPVRRKVVDSIAAYTRKYNKNRFIVTSRITGYLPDHMLDEYDAYTLIGLTEQQIEEFVLKYYRSYEQQEQTAQEPERPGTMSEPKDTRLLQIIRSDTAIRLLAANPLLLAILSLIQQQVAPSAYHRVTYFKQCTNVLLYSWFKSKGFSDPGTREMLYKVVEGLALWAQEQDNKDFSENEIKTQIKRIIENEDEILAERHFVILHQYLGILIEKNDDDWRSQRYGFSHAPLKEYFAANAIAIQCEKDRNDLIRKYLRNPSWHEVIRLVISIIGHSNKSKREKEKDVTDLIQNVIIHAHSPSEEQLHRDLLFAGYCIADNADIQITNGNNILRSIVFYYLKSRSDWPGEPFIPVFTAWSNAPVVVAKIKEVVQPFLDLRNDDTSTAADSLSRFDPFGDDNLERYYKDLKRYDLQEEVDLVCLRIMILLYYLRDDTACLIQESRKLFSTSSPCGIRYAAALTLGILGREDKSVLDDLLQALSDDEWQVRLAAAIALGRLGNDYIGTPGPLLALLTADQLPTVKEAVLIALGFLGNADETVWQAVLPMIADDRASVRRTALITLGQLGSLQPGLLDDVQVLEILQASLGDADSSVRHAAATIARYLILESQQATVIEIQQKMIEIRQKIIEMLDIIRQCDPYLPVREVAQTALEYIGRASGGIDYPASMGIGLHSGAF